jgi:hypothetical protein
MKKDLREIQAYSSNSNEELNYKERYWFHHWLSKKKALIETEDGKMITARFNEFYFIFKQDNPS